MPYPRTHILFQRVNAAIEEGDNARMQDLIQELSAMVSDPMTRPSGRSIVAGMVWKLHMAAGDKEAAAFWAETLKVLQKESMASLGFDDNILRIWGESRQVLQERRKGDAKQLINEMTEILDLGSTETLVRHLLEGLREQLKEMRKTE